MKESDILKLQKKLDKEPFVKETEYISKKQALREQTEAMGTDPQEFLGYNPFTASIEIKLHSGYANSEVAPQERTPDEAPACPHQLHRMDKEPFGVNGQADCIVYQGKRDESQEEYGYTGGALSERPD